LAPRTSNTAEPPSPPKKKPALKIRGAIRIARALIQQLLGVTEFLVMPQIL
jgi:hypothetical protein